VKAEASDHGNIPAGISIFYLCYWLALSRGGKKALVTYLESTFGEAPDTEEFANKLEAIYSRRTRIRRMANKAKVTTQVPKKASLLKNRPS
jgi:hypothetical protein